MFSQFSLRYLVAILLLVSGLLYAQSGTSTITGTVTDQTGAVMAGVKIAVREPATGFERETVTNDTGNYSLPGLQPATYDIAAELKGFRKRSQRGFVLEVNHTARLDMQLEIGEVTSVVEVQGATALLQSENSSVGLVIDRKKIIDLPLNGRNFVTLALLVPGVNTGQPGAGRGGGISIGGTRSEQNSFQLDGVSNTDQWDSGISFRPTIDAIQEFRIEVNNYAAEFGRSAGGQISVITKSGTNELHGSLYEFHRNDAFQARNYFDRNPNFVNKKGEFVAPPLIRNEFGAAVGGPVFKNKTFFFADYQGSRQVRGNVGRRTVPDAAFKNGDFSAVLGAVVGTDSLGRQVRANQIFDPLTSRSDPSRPGRFLRDPFPDNKIPLNRFDPVSRAILQKQLWPDPNTAGTRDARTGNPVNNFFDARSTRDIADQFMVRIDHRFSENDVFYARYGFNDTDSFSPGSFPGNERLSPNRQQVLAGSYTKTFGPTKVNDLRVSYQRERPQNGAERILQGVNLVKELGIRGLPLAGPGAPVISITGFTSIDDGGESRRSDDTLQFIDQFSFNKGRHFFKVGGELRRIELDVLNNPANTRGDFNFGNQEWTGLEGFSGTGNTFANFLLGLPRQKARRPGDHSSFLRATEYAGFFQDDFKASAKLTINYGVRYQLYIPPKETRNNISAIRIPGFPASFAEGGIAFCKDRQRCASLSTTLDPLRLGLTLNDLNVDRLPQIVVAGREVPRSLVDVEKYNFGPRLGIAYRLTPNTVIRTGYGVFFDTVPASYFQDAVENLPFVREDQQSLSSFQFGLPTSETFIGFLLNDPPIGSFTPGPNTFGINFQNAYVQHWNFGVQRQLGGNLVAEVTYAGSKGTRLNRRENFNTREPRSPNAIIPTSVNPHLRRLLPFAIFDGQLITLDNWFETTSTAFSTYHALMTRIEKRFSGGLTFINSFTWSKAISDAQPFSGGDNDTGNRIQDIYNKKADKGLAPYDHKFRFTSSFIYELPFGQGKRFGSDAKGIVNHLIGGWQVNGIVSLQSGFPITIRRSGDPLGIGTDGAVRPDQICDPTLSEGERTRDPVSGSVTFFKGSCFAAPADRFGTAGRSTVTGPGSTTADLAIFKNIRIRESTQLQFRGEFFNAFNHPNWNQPGRDLGGSNFGIATSARDPRIIQFGLKLLF
ncbi:MAG: TonB-dependent receptor [Acidobacteria bacterium]|nr:TonB-dependent receptor [Acidobacteriota bacterium]